MKCIEERICKYRERSGLSQLDLAEKLDVSRQAISKWETGASIPELPKLIKMSEIFGVSLDELIIGNESEPAVKEENKKEESKNSTGNIIWGIFFLFAGLALSIVLYIKFSDPSIFIILPPFVLSGVYFLQPFAHVWLWSGYTWFILVSGWLRYGAGVSWSRIFDKDMYSPHESTWCSVLSWVEFLALICLIAATVYVWRNKKFDISKTKRMTLASICGATVILRIAVQYISPIIGSALWGVSKEKTTTYELHGVIHTVYEEGWMESKEEVLSILDFSIETILLTAFIICLVPTFYWIKNAIKAKKK